MMKLDCLMFNHKWLTATLAFGNPITFSTLLLSMKMLVSSANKLENNLSETLCRSLMQIKKNIKPKSDPCGIPKGTNSEIHLEVLIMSNCCLLSTK